MLEGRRLLAAWGGAPILIQLNDLVAAHPELNGAGQTIAILDTGIDYNDVQLGGGFGSGKKVIGGYDFVDNDSDPLDTNGHGTEVAGVIAADQFQDGGLTYQGIAPAAKLVALRIAADTSAIPLDRIATALQWVIANNSTFHFTAVNLSFGFGRFDSDESNDTLSASLQQLADLNIAFVASAGNAGVTDGPGISYPAADANAFSVGSVNSSDVISEFSQRSSNLDLLAPGEDVHSTGLNNTFVTVAGTSFSAPALTGTIALVRQVDPLFSLGDVKSMIRASSPTNFDGDMETGDTTNLTYQRLDVLDTVNLALQRKSASSDIAATIGVSGTDNDIAFDDEGVLHFAWYDNAARTAKYATRSLDGNWSAPMSIDNSGLDIGTELSLKLDSYGKPVIAYLDGPNGDLKVARYTGVEWHHETVDDKGVTGLYPSLAIDANDQYFVAYYRKTTRDLKLATFENGFWSRQTIDSDGDVGAAASIALDNNNLPGIAYADSGRNRLKIARKTGTGWSINVVDYNVLGAAYVSLAFDANGMSDMSYYEVTTADLKLATQNSDGWGITRVATKGATGLYTNLDIDEDGTPSILYWDRRTNSLNRAKRSGSKFVIKRIAGTAGKYTVATHSTADGRWTYSTNTGSKLVVQEIT